MLWMEAECERLTAENIAGKEVAFKFIERLEVYSLLELHIPKALQAHIR